MTPAIQVRHLQKTFGRGKHEVQAVKDVDFSVEEGQVFGFLGSKWCG